MLTFFRKLRRNNMNGRYFKYAVGEIVLVVIGILIALSINNWNEARKSKKLEKEILTEMHSSLLKDQRLLNVISHRLDQKDSAMNIILNAMQVKREIPERDANELMTQTLIRVTLSYDAGSYEALISSGLDIVKDKVLRSLIIRFYKVTLPRNDQFIDGLKNEYMPRTLSLIEEATQVGLIKSELVKMENGEWKVQPKLDFKNIFKSKQWNDIMINESNLAGKIRYRLEPLALRTQELIDAISAQLKK